MPDASAESGVATAPRIPVGWRMSSPQAALAFLPPEPLAQDGGGDDLLSRLVRIRAPYDLRLRVSPPGHKPQGFARIGRESSISEAAFRGLVTPIAPHAQRRPDVMAVQIALNLRFITDAPCTLELMPPFLSESFRRWPGPIVSGRFPLTDWPRPLNAVIEWQDRDRDLVIRRGDDMAHVRIHFDDPAALPHLVEAADTPALRRHLARIDDVSSVGRNVRPMFAEAAARHPARLLVPKETGAPDW
ncbi:MAG: hypothetical protein AAFU72_04380 [Pseudomonadota bacterium]